MLHLPTLDELWQRAIKAGTSVGKLAKLAGVNPDIFYRAKREGTNIGYEAVRAVFNELVKHESAQLEYFVALFNGPPGLARDLIAKRNQGRLPLDEAKAPPAVAGASA